MYVLFKKCIQSDLYSDFEIKEVVKDLQRASYMMSNVS